MIINIVMSSQSKLDSKFDNLFGFGIKNKIIIQC